MQTKQWITIAKGHLQASLSPVPHELNELDWKLKLSDDNERLTHHLSAFANQREGGYFAFGVDPDGQSVGVSSEQTKAIVGRLGNIARDGLEPPQRIDHMVETIDGVAILLVHVFESTQKPVHIRGQGIEQSYIRSGGQTRKMSRQEIAQAVLASRQMRYEELEALTCQESDVLALLDCERLLQLLGVPAAQTPAAILEELVNQKVVYRHNGHYSITNLGAIAAARDFTKFPGKERFPVRVIKYRGGSRIETEVEREFVQGYGVAFQELIRYIMGQLPTSEVIQDALRRNVPVYPEITVRELVANALVHRNFSLTGSNPMVEIFVDRMEIANPGGLLPSVKIDRLIGAAPESRNELFAALMRRMGICEERGSGIVKALFAVEVFGLPPVKFAEETNVFRAVLYSPKRFAQMLPEERLNACYQHCCLRYVSGEPMTNASLRKRMGLKDAQYALAWRVIDAAIERQRIKPRGSGKQSRRYAAYVPFWA